MTHVVIFGGCSTICRQKVYKHLECNHNKYATIYAFDMKVNTTETFRDYLLKQCMLRDATFIKKFQYVYGQFDIPHYEKYVVSLLQDDTIIYVGTPSICYPSILEFLNTVSKRCKVILEKPLGTNKEEFEMMCTYINYSKQRVYLCDHYIYKCKT